MSRVASPSQKRPYGVARVCRAWSVARATVYRQRGATAADSDPQPSRSPVRRRGPDGACPDAELVAQIAAEIAASPFHGEGYRRSGRGCVTRVSARRRGGCGG
jgi:putative transposase